MKNIYPNLRAYFAMIELKKEYDQYGLKMTLTGNWEQGSAGCVNYPAIEEAIYDARKLRYEMSNNILSLMVIPNRIYEMRCPVTICAIEDRISDPKAA